MGKAKDIKIETVTIGGITYSADMATVLSADLDITTFHLERGVRYIGENAFANCHNLRVVRIPKTVIRIEDFAFRDCQNLCEVHLPYYMEYISPLAFTLSEKAGNTFYNNNIKMFFPEDASQKFAYMIPQFIPIFDYDSSDQYNDFFEYQDNYDFPEGLSIYVNEDELYRMVVKDYIRNYYNTEEADEKVEDTDADIQALCDDVIDFMFSFGFGNLIGRDELVDTNKHQIINSVDESFGSLVDNIIKDWVIFTPDLRPLDIMYMAMNEVLVMGFIPASIWDHPDDKNYYGDRLYEYLKNQYVDIRDGFYNHEVVNDEILEEWYQRLEVDVEVMLDYFTKIYSEAGHPIHAKAFKSIVRHSMRILFRVGYSYGLKYRGKVKCNSEGPFLFSEEEMHGGVRTDFFDKQEDAYLEAIRIVSKLDDVSFSSLTQEVDQQERFKDMYWIRMLPGYIMDSIQFQALCDIIGLRRGYKNHLFSYDNPYLTVPSSFEKAKKRFENELPKEEYRYVEWINFV